MSNVASAASVVEAARAKMKRILDAIHRLLFVLQWIHGHGEVALLYAEDLTIYVRRRHIFTPAPKSHTTYYFFSMFFPSFCWGGRGGARKEDVLLKGFPPTIVAGTPPK